MKYGKLLKYLLGIEVTFTKSEQQTLKEHLELLAKHQLTDLLMLLMNNNQSLVEKLINSANFESLMIKAQSAEKGEKEEIEKEVKKEDNSLIQQNLHYQKLFALLDIMLHLENKASADNDNEPAEKWAKIFVNLFAPNIEVSLKDYVKRFINTGSEQPIFDLFNFKLTASQDHMAHWRDVLLQYGPKIAKKYFKYADKIETYCQDKGMPLPKNRSELETITLLSVYERANEDKFFASECLKKNIPESAFNLALDIAMEKGKKSDNLPNIFVDGKQCHAPRFYLRKLDCQDKRGFILGKYSDCCQHIAHEMGKDAAILGMTSPNSAFYVLVKRPAKIGGPEEIIGQSWAWLSKEGHLVFDSWEFRREQDAPLLQPFMSHFIDALPPEIDGVYLGSSGGTPKDLPYHHITENLPQPIDATGFRDSKIGQWCIREPRALSQQLLQPTKG